jgi:hypothetical protein
VYEYIIQLRMIILIVPVIICGASAERARDVYK